MINLIPLEACDLNALRTGVVCITDFEADTDLCRAPGTANECTCCGDSVIQGTETCDRATAGTCNTGQACRTSGADACTCCGDDLLQGTEQCDGAVFEAGAPTGRTCRPDCTFCGDGNTDTAFGEQCDDGNAIDNDACGNDCTPPEGEGICRTPGFWGTHARANPDKPRSQNITQAVINAGGGSLHVCGECINATVPVNNAASSVEATCVSPRGAIVLQNARQLTAMALNCVISGFGANCGGNAALSGLFSDCNNACLGAGSTRTNARCRDEIDCFNNGGQFNSTTGSCQTGTCANGAACNDSTSCLDLSPCTPLPDNCHDRPLVNEDLRLDFDPPGPAGSSDDCNAAIGNHCAILPLACSNIKGGGDGETCCGSDSCPNP